MRNNLAAAALTAVILIPCTVGAMTLQNLTFDADCTGWNATLTVAVRPGAMMARGEYVVLLRDAAGVELERFEYADWLTLTGTATAVYQFNGAWTGDLDGAYVATGDFMIYDVFPDGYNLTSDTASLQFACGSAGGEELPPLVDPCRYSDIYWSHNVEEWPVTSVELGAESFDQDQMMTLLSRQYWWSASARLAGQLVAAKLNVANGADAPRGDLIGRADAYLSSHPVFTHLHPRHARRTAMELAMKLWRYNRAGCPAGVTPSGSQLGIDLRDDAFGAMADEEDKAAEEVMNLGTVKAMFR